MIGQPAARRARRSCSTCPPEQRELPRTDPPDARSGRPMIKQAPSIGRIFAMVAFALSCFGILLFLWLSVRRLGAAEAEGLPRHGAVPGGHAARPGGRRADLRRARRQGRSRSSRTPRPACTDAVLEIDSRYAPLPRDTRAILRQKTLLGETYVELSPGDAERRQADARRTAARCRAGRCRTPSSSTRSCARSTRARAQRVPHWFDQQGTAVRGRAAQAINDALGNLDAVRRGHRRRRCDVLNRAGAAPRSR